MARQTRTQGRSFNWNKEDRYHTLLLPGLTVDVASPTRKEVDKGSFHIFTQ
jgi:hypothetical protein